MTHRSAAPSDARALIVWDTASNDPGCSPAATAHPQASSTGATADETRPHHGTLRTVTTVSYRDALPGRRRRVGVLAPGRQHATEIPLDAVLPVPGPPGQQVRG